MGIAAMEIKYAGLTKHKGYKGNVRYRVRHKNNKNKRMDLPVSPDSPHFHACYLAARCGERYEIPKDPILSLKVKSFGWLVHKHLEWMEREVEAGNRSPRTLKKRKGLLSRLLTQYADHEMLMPRKAVIGIRNELTATPATADSTVEALSVMYKWAIDAELVPNNPCLTVGRIDKNRGGATPWTPEDIKQFFAYHRIGTSAHTALSLMLWTGCRVGDLCHIGPRNEVVHTVDGRPITFVDFQPTKKGAAFVSVPLVPPLKRSIEAQKVRGFTYILTYKAKPLSSPDSASAQFCKWCKQAGLKNRSAHGVRKALGNLVASLGASEFAVMAVLGHTDTKSAKAYTNAYKRRNLAFEAMEQLEAVEL